MKEVGISRKVWRDALHNNTPAMIQTDLMERERFTKLNTLFAAFLTITFTLANLPLSVLDYMALTTP